MPYNVITFSQAIADNNIQRITLSKQTLWVTDRKTVKKSSKNWQHYNIYRMLTLTVITVSGLHCSTSLL
jgi:hypothetical protein